MGAYPRIVTADRLISWDGVTQRLPKGQVIDVPPGSALEAAIGLQNLVPLGAVTPAPPPAEPVPAEPAAKEKPEPGPVKPVPAVKAPEAGTTPVKSGDGKDGSE